MIPSRILKERYKEERAREIHRGGLQAGDSVEMMLQFKSKGSLESPFFYKGPHCFSLKTFNCFNATHPLYGGQSAFF